jgi:hypothetical protein
LAAAAAYAAGLRGEKLRMAVAIALGESSGRPRAHGDRNNPRHGCGSYGLWQINSCPGRDGSGSPRYGSHPKALYNPLTNARSMMKVSKGGKNWGPWAVFTSGTYRSHLGAADSALAWLKTSAGRAAVKQLLGKGGTVPKDTSPKALTLHQHPITPVRTTGTAHPAHPAHTTTSTGGTPVRIKVTPAQLRSAHGTVQGWVKNDVPTGRHTASTIPTTFAAACKGDMTAHNTVLAAMRTAQPVWDEAFRLTLKDLGLVAAILDKGATHFDLKDAELANLVRNQKDIA